MFSLLQKRVPKLLPTLLPLRTRPFKPRLFHLNSTFSFSSRQFTVARPDMLFAGAAVFLSIGGVAYGIINSAENKQITQNGEGLSPAKITKQEAKLIIEEAMKCDAQGDNEKALELYNTALQVYRRANKASDKKLTMLRQRIAILTSFEGKDKRALFQLTDSYQMVCAKTLTEDLHFELYYDLCVMYYKFGQYIPATMMFKSCLDFAKLFYPNENEIHALIHQYLGFAYYKRGQIHKGEEHLTIALKYINTIKADNKAFLYYASNEFSDFYTSIADYKKALLFVEQAKVLLNQEAFFDRETIEKGMKIHSPYTQKYIRDLRKEKQVKALDAKSRMLMHKLGDYEQNNTKRNHTINKLTKQEKNTRIHGLLNW